ncbi:MAG: alpha amylase C-terminal domain-containing protein, partial [Sphingobium sp.]|nr:alpha amylase C-terminal domain-containing protein [Sphingobium sp.]
SEERALDWGLRGHDSHEGVRNLVRDLNRLYRTVPALHQRDCEADGFEWLIVDDTANSVFAWLRKAPGTNPVAIISNMTPAVREGYVVPVGRDGWWREVLNSDAKIYGGSGVGNLGGVSAQGGKAALTLPPLATVMLQFEG